MKIALVGATGLTGGLTLTRLLQRNEVSEVISIGRRPTGVQHPKLREVLWSGADEIPEVRVDAWICCLGTTRKKAGSAAAFRAVDLDLPLMLARSLHRQGCEAMVVVSAMGAAAGSRVLYSQTKGELEEKLQQVGFASLGILRPSLISGERAESRPLERLADGLLEVLNPLLIGRLSHYRSIRAEEIADALVNLAIQPRPGTNIYLSETIKQISAT